MDFLALAQKRYSCRNYKPDMVSDDLILQVIEAARIAPSAVNFQPWHFYIIRKPENKALLAETYQREWMRTAPVLIVACGNRNISWKRSDGKEHVEIDLSIAIDHMTLKATELGLATCWICNFQAKKLKEVMHMPSHMDPVAILPLGYPADEPDLNRHQTKRKPLSEIVSWEFDV